MTVLVVLSDDPDPDRDPIRRQERAQNLFLHATSDNDAVQQGLPAEARDAGGRAGSEPTDRLR
jgi:hypothetical protein